MALAAAKYEILKIQRYITKIEFEAYDLCNEQLSIYFFFSVLSFVESGL